MTKATTVSLWAPRIAGIALALFLSLFAFDAVGRKPWIEAVPDVAMHLAPALIVMAAVALAWRFPLIGAAAFGAFALIYAFAANGRIDWILAISGPLAMVAALFLVSGLRRAASVPES